MGGMEFKGVILLLLLLGYVLGHLFCSYVVWVLRADIYNERKNAACFCYSGLTIPHIFLQTHPASYPHNLA